MHPRDSNFLERFINSIYLYISMEEELKCAKCNSSQTRYRVKSDDRICYSCGNIFKIDKKEEAKE